MERDWAAYEQCVNDEGIYSPEVAEIASLALAERRRMAELLDKVWPISGNPEAIAASQANLRRLYDLSRPSHRDNQTLSESAIAEIQRLAELLTWRPGPPTEPGLYLRSYGFIRLVTVLNPDAWTRWGGQDNYWFGPLPQPPSEE